MTQAPTALTRSIDQALARLQAEPPTPQRLESQLRQLAKWRSIVLANTLLARTGSTIPAGPFQGMSYSVEASEGGRVPRLLGAYEASLHPVIETVITRAYPQILDIGCAEGYYAVGLARRMPKTTVHARDTDPRARALCQTLAKANAVEDRVQVGPEATHADFAVCGDARTFVLCDIEGAEGPLLDPAHAPRSGRGRHLGRSSRKHAPRPPCHAHPTLQAHSPGLPDRPRAAPRSSARLG